MTDRVCPSFTGDAKEEWERIRDRYPDKSDSERLEILTERLTDPWDLALSHYDDFQTQAYTELGAKGYELIGFFRAILQQMRRGVLDEEEALHAIQEAISDVPRQKPDEEV